MTDGDAHARTSSGAASSPQKPVGDSRRIALLLVLCITAGSAVGLFLLPRAPAPVENRIAPETLSFLGSEFELEQEASEKIREKAHDYLARTFTLLLPGQPSVVFPLSKWGIVFDEERLNKNVEDALDASSPSRRVWAERVRRVSGKETEAVPKEQRTLSLPPPYAVDREVLVSHLLRQKDRVDRNPADARLDLARGSIVAEVEGRWLDIDATLVKMLAALDEDQLSTEAVVRTRTPSRVKSQLEGLRFDHVLGHFETRYNRAQKYEDRTYNLRLAAQKLDGTVLFPGEEFDFNAIVGPRDEANGYKVATVIADGELVDGIGGGTCQISGTLHGAAFFAGLHIQERYPHTRPSSYIKMGMDATVVYPTINFRFKNPFDFPIALHESVEAGVVRAEILGPHIDQVVTLIRKVDEAIPYEQLERKDPRLPRGQRILAQRGIPGFRLHRYRTVRRGSHTRREKWRDVYPPTPQVIRIGTGEPSLEKRHSVGTPEYRADELLILTLTRGGPGTPGEFAENREPGRYGHSGWTRDEGMPFWDD